MKKETSQDSIIENYLNHFICISATCSVTVFALMLKTAYVIDLSSMNVFQGDDEGF